MADRPTTTPTTLANASAAIDAFAFAVARGDAEAAGRCVAATNDDERVLRPALSTAAAAVGGFGAAMVDRFGATAAAGRWGVETSKPAAVAAGVVREGDAWRLTFAGVATVLRGRGVELAVPVDEPLRRLAEMRDALDHVTADVRAGRYPTADAAADAARDAWANASRGAQAQ